jgi:hypothetical protein
VAISILLVLAENRSHLHPFQLADLPREGVDPVGASLDDEGNDVDALVTKGNSLTAEDDLRVFGKEGVNPRDACLTGKENEDAAKSLFYRNRSSRSEQVSTRRKG